MESTTKTRVSQLAFCRLELSPSPFVCNTALSVYEAYPQFSTDCSPVPITGVNRTTCKANFVHQAGAYQRDAPYTDTPFYSPSLAKFCSGNSCIFASWGTQAHVETPFTSSIMNINKYTNCGSGVIEHVQMMHNFADPNNPDGNPNFARDTDYTYFNVGE